MTFITYGSDPWGRTIFTGLAWDALWVSIFIVVTFVVAHAAYIVLSAHRGRPPAETDALEATHPDVPERITRHSLMARLFHWVMAAAMFVLLVTAFVPILGIQFDWIVWHWVSGLVLTGTILYHIVHTTFWLDFWSIWVGPKDIAEFKAELQRGAGRHVPGPKPAKYPLGNRLYHLILVVVGAVVITTDLFMMPRIDQPFFERNPSYLLSEAGWGWVYVGHALVGLSLVGLVGAHVYFAARPSKWWVTRSMILGWITRREYFDHYEPNRWPIK